MGYILLVIAFTLNGAANILLKAGAVRLGAWSGPAFISRLATNYYLMAGLFLFALNAVFYVAALARLNLSVAYPVMVAGEITIVVSVSILFLGETIAASQLIGLVLLTAGAMLIVHQPLS
jgi:small multidrug resistance pump